MAYCVIQDIRDEGIDVSELSDVRAQQLIDDWSAWIDKMTGQFFELRDYIIDMDGNGARTLFLPVPIVTCNNLYMNDDFANAIATDLYVVYNQRNPINDDRKNPKITLKREVGSIFTSIKSGIFEVGDRNQRIDASWGYVESDDSTPAAIRRAIVILVTMTAELLADDEIDQLRGGRLVEEVTDRHRVQYSDLFYRLGAWFPTGVTEVDFVLRSYRSPIKIEAPRTMWGV